MRQKNSQLRGADGKPDPKAIARAAAMLGPGHNGQRAELDEKQWQQHAEELQELYKEAGLGDAPAYLKSRTEWKDRKAKLFEIGNYGDKSLDVTEADLQKLARTFDAPVPILIEHVENPLRLGYLTQVEAAGPELFGVLALTPEADELLEASGAKSLSVSIAKDFSKILEVSIVGNPRVESAKLFCADFRSQASPSERREITQLRLELESVKVRDIVERFAREGVIVPSNREQAETLIRKARAAGFEAEAVAFFETLPKRIHFGETAKVPAVRSALSAEETEFYKKHFPGLPVEEIAKRKEVMNWQP